MPSSSVEVPSNSAEEKSNVKRQLSFAVSETIGDDVFRRFLATDGVLYFWRNFAYEEHVRLFYYFIICSFHYFNNVQMFGGSDETCFSLCSRSIIVPYLL